MVLATIRNRIGRREDQFLATVFIGSGLLFVAMMFVGGAAAAAPVTLKSLAGTTIDPDTATIGRGIAYALYFVYGIKMAAVFILVSSTIGLRSGALPRWFCLLGYPTALALLLVVFVSEYVVLAFPAWVAITSLILILERDPLTPAAAAGLRPIQSARRADAARAMPTTMSPTWTAMIAQTTGTVGRIECGWHGDDPEPEPEAHQAAEQDAGEDEQPTQPGDALR